MKTLQISGTPYFAEEEARLFSAWPDWNVGVFPVSSIPGGALSDQKTQALSDRFADTRVWYQIGGHSLRQREAAFQLVHDDLGVSIVVKWTGSDIAAMASYFSANPASLHLARTYVHWCAAPWFVDELRLIGIDADFVPFTSEKRRSFLAMKPPPLPERFTVLSYIPDGLPEVYGWNIIAEVARAFPEIEFAIARGTGKDLAAVPANVRFLGWLDDIYDAYRQCSVVVRMTKHDGYGGTIQEGLLLGRHAIWTYPFPGALQAADSATLQRQIAGLLRLHIAGQLEINREGREYIRQHLNPDALCDRKRRQFSELADARRDHA